MKLPYAYNPSTVAYAASLYVATKYASVEVTKRLVSAEKLEGVTAVAVCPGYVLCCRPL